MNQPLTALALFAFAATAFGQGNLLPPPGPPGPTMKTLDQVEARTIINATNTPGDGSNSYIITLPGSYYLTGNLVGESGRHGISIQASDVTLDLNGFVLSGVAGSLHGVTVPATATNVAVRNGTVRSWGQRGVDAEQVRNGRLERLSASHNAATGIAAGSNSLVTACVAMNNSAEGISALRGCTISNCSAQSNATGIYTFDLSGGCDISDCSALYNTGVGIFAIYGNSVKGCTVRYNGSIGISASTSCTISGCTISRNNSDGIVAFSRNLIVNNNVSENGINSVNGDGISTYGGENRIDGNHTTGNNGRGIRSTGGEDFIIRNTSTGNSAGNYTPLSGATIGPIGGTPGTATSPWANF